MNKKNFFEGGGNYVAPEMEVISVAAECGVAFSTGENGNGGFGDTPEDDGFDM